LELQDSEILGTLPKTCPRIFRDNKTEVEKRIGARNFWSAESRANTYVANCITF
jgi:hypothetical protein